MSLFVLDDHLDEAVVGDRVRRWARARYVHDIRPREVVKDERVLSILGTVRTPTFVIIDDWFWSRAHRDPRYCILYLALSKDEQADIHPLLRRLLHLPEFRTRAARMGKVVWVSRDHVRWWQLDDQSEHTVHWGRSSRPRPGR